MALRGDVTHEKAKWKSSQPKYAEQRTCRKTLCAMKKNRRNASNRWGSVDGSLHSQKIFPLIQLVLREKSAHEAELRSFTFTFYISYVVCSPNTLMVKHRLASPCWTISIESSLSWQLHGATTLFLSTKLMLHYNYNCLKSFVYAFKCSTSHFNGIWLIQKLLVARIFQ